MQDTLADRQSLTQCPKRNRPYLWAIDASQHRVYFLRPNCGQWDCPYCSQKLRARWVARLCEHIKRSEKTWWFITLTVRGDRRGFERSIEDWRKGWTKLYARMKRKYPDLEYAQIPEIHKDKTIHVHMFSSEDFDAVKHPTPKKPDGYVSRWIKDKPAACGLGWMNDIEPVTTLAAAGYASKYLGKQLGEVSYPSGFMHIRTSQHWFDFADEHRGLDSLQLDFHATIREDEFEAMIFRWWGASWETINLSTGAIENDILAVFPPETSLIDRTRISKVDLL